MLHTSVREDVLPLRELSAELLGECSEPSFGLPITRIDGIEVLISHTINKHANWLSLKHAMYYLVININTIEVEFLDPCRHGVSDGRRVNTGRCRGIRRTEGGYD